MEQVKETLFAYPATLENKKALGLYNEQGSNEYLYSGGTPYVCTVELNEDHEDDKALAQELFLNGEMRQQLTETQWDCLSRYVAGMTYAQIGRELGIKGEVAAAHIKKAGKRLLPLWRYKCGEVSQPVELKRRKPLEQSND